MVNVNSNEKNHFFRLSQMMHFYKLNALVTLSMQSDVIHHSCVSVVIVNWLG